MNRPAIRRGWAWGCLIGSRTWLTISGSHWAPPTLAPTSGDAVRRYAHNDVLALVEEVEYAGVGSGLAYRIVEIAEPTGDTQ